jgi:hypothetical protein
MAWREAPDKKRMAIRSGDGSARSVRAIGKNQPRVERVGWIALFATGFLLRSIQFGSDVLVASE